MNNKTINFMYFIFNYPQDFIQKVWSDEQWLAKHIEDKWSGYHKQYGNPTLAFNKWFMELDRANQNKL